MALTGKKCVENVMVPSLNSGPSPPLLMAEEKREGERSSLELGGKIEVEMAF